MSFSASEIIYSGEREIIIGRAKTYVLVRLTVDIIVLVLSLLQFPAAFRNILVAFVVAIDIIGLLVYWLVVKKWPAASTYVQLIFAAILIIAFDFAWGSITLIPWFFTIPLSIAGGLIITRSGFNGLVTLSILVIFGVYMGFIIQERAPLPLDIPKQQLLLSASALAAVLIMLNALIEMLVVYIYKIEETLLQTRAQLLYVLQELEQNKHLLQQVQNQTRRMERLSTVGQIAERLSKSLRGPLEKIEHILSHPEQIQNDPQTIEQLHRQVLATLQLTEGLKEYANLTELHVRTVNLDDILAQELSRIQIPQGVELHIDQPPVFPPIQADPEKVGLAIHHLIKNALQAIDNNGKIEIELKSRPDGVTFSIRDNGPGIPHSEIPTIFEPLYTTRARGFGLGLAIAQRVVEMHGGYIEVESEPGQGSLFTIFFPRVPEQEISPAWPADAI